MKNGRTQVPPSTAADISTRETTTTSNATEDGATPQRLSICSGDSRIVVIEICIRFEPTRESNTAYSAAGGGSGLFNPIRDTRAAWRRARILETLQQLGYEPRKTMGVRQFGRIEAKARVLAKLREVDGERAWGNSSFLNAWTAVRRESLTAKVKPKRNPTEPLQNWFENRDEGEIDSDRELP